MKRARTLYSKLSGALMAQLYWALYNVQTVINCVTREICHKIITLTTGYIDNVCSFVCVCSGSSVILDTSILCLEFEMKM